jgi:ribosomal protein S18 acetylase RimI-like enzyme
MINIREYELLSLETGAYRDIELDILKETLAAWKESPGAPFELIELRDGQVLAGFCLYYKSPNTEYTFDIHTFVVARDYKGKQVGPRLVELIEERLLEGRPFAVIRIETSKVKESSVGDGFFQSAGFQTIGHIPGFYDTENDYYIYMKAVSAIKPKERAERSERIDENRGEGKE